MNTLEKKKFTVREMTSLAMMAALGVILAAVVHVPLIPGASFLEYDPADIPIFITAFAFGPIPGLIVTVIVSVIQGVTVSAASGAIGILMHIAATGTFVLLAGGLYARQKTMKRAALALAIGVVAQTMVMIGLNLVFTPIFMGVEREVVMGMILPAILPFNLAKAGINAVLTFALYKPLTRVMRGRGWVEAQKAEAKR